MHPKLKHLAGASDVDRCTDLMKLPPVHALVFLVLTLPAAAQDLLWSGSGSGIIEEISLTRSSGLAEAGDPGLGTPVDYEYFLLGTHPSGTLTTSESGYAENIYVSQNAGYGSVSPFVGSAGNHAFSTGYPSLGGTMGGLRIVNDLVFDTTPLLNSFRSGSGLLGAPSQLEGDSIIFYDDTDFSRVSSTSYNHTLLILNDPSGTAFDSADFGSAEFDLSKFATAKLYRESVSATYAGSYHLSFVADLKCIPEPGALLLVAMGALPLARRRRRG
jgi:hypothetical protein